MFHHLVCHFNRITHAKYKYRQRISASLGLLLQSWQSDDDKAALPARKWRNSCYEVSAPSSCVRRRWIDCVWRATATKNCASVGDWPAPSGRRCSRLLRRRGWAVCGAPQSTAGRWRVTVWQRRGMFVRIAWQPPTSLDYLSQSALVTTYGSGGAYITRPPLVTALLNLRTDQV